MSRVVMRLVVHTEQAPKMTEYVAIIKRVQKMCGPDEEAFCSAPSGPLLWHFEIRKKAKP